MKRKWKWLVLAAVLITGFATWLVIFSQGNVPIDVVGKLSEKDVAEIVALIKRKFRKQILPDFSWRSIRNSPAAFRRYLGIKLYTIIPSADVGEVKVFAWSDTNSIKRNESRQDYWSAESRKGIWTDFQAMYGTNSTAMIVTRQPDGWKFANFWYD